MLIPVHTLDTLPTLDQVALVAYANPLQTGAAGAPDPLRTPAPSVEVAAAEPLPLPQITTPVYSLPASDGSDLPLRIKRGICSAMVAIPLSLYLYFSLMGPLNRGRAPQSGKTADAAASKHSRTIAHEALAHPPVGHPG